MNMETIESMGFIEFVDSIRSIFDQPDGTLNDLLDRIQQARYAEKVIEYAKTVEE